ncbi:MAG: cyclase family protein [Anaerolineaceae bacterium]
MTKRMFDISVPISTALPVWPGDPPIEIDQDARMIDGASANVSRINMSVHTGTHIDAPLHFFENGLSTDKIAIEKMVGVVEIIQINENTTIITESILKGLKQNLWPKRVIFKTSSSLISDWSQKPFRKDFCALSTGAAEYLVQQGVKLVGIDYLSIAPYEEPDEVHRILLVAGVVVLEGLNLYGISIGNYKLICLPLNITGVEGAPARVILLEQ